MPIPADYYARCTETECTWHANANDADYRNELAQQHRTRYGHAVATHDYL